MTAYDKTQKAELVAHTLRQRIADGTYPAGDRLPTREQLRNEFDVSNATLQRAMNWLLAEGFVETARRSGTTVRADSPHLSRYALLFPKRFTDSGPVNHIFRALRTQAATIGQGRQVTIHDGFEGRAGFIDYESLLDDMRQNRLAGLIFAASPYVLAGTSLVADDGLPRVGLMTRGTALPHIASAYFDIPAFNRRALRMVRDRGCRRVAWLCNDTSQLSPELQALAAELGLDLPTAWYHGLSLHEPAWTRHLLHLLFAPEQPRPDALVVTNDNLLPTVSQTLLELGVRVPDDLYLLAHANFPELTDSAVPVERLGFSIPDLLGTAIDMIDRARRGDPMPPPCLLPPISAAEYAPISKTK